jgi:putative ABC transport system ATP-binding protein
MAMSAVAVSVRDVTKTYAQGEAAMRALDGVDLDVSRGDLVLLMGPSGSGKTTLLSIMGCILRPTSGSVRVLEREVSSLPERALPRVRLDNIGFVFQGFNLFPTLTAQANVALALDLKGVARRDAARRAGALLEQVGLGGKLEAYPADLSGGQKQRVAIARAIAGDPPIVLADEPTAALDTQSGHAVMDLLRALAHERDRSVVIVSHDSRMLGYADRIVHLEDGRIVEADVEPPGPAEAGHYASAHDRGSSFVTSSHHVRLKPDTTPGLTIVDLHS